MAQDSPLSITASVVGILTFAVALLLGVYARLISIRQELDRLIRVDAEIVETAIKTFRSLSESFILDENIRNYGGGTYDEQLKVILVQIFLLEITSVDTLMNIIGDLTLKTRFDWERQRNLIAKAAGEIEGLRSKIFHSQLMMLSRKIDTAERAIQKSIDQSIQAQTTVMMHLQNQIQQHNSLVTGLLSSLLHQTYEDTKRRSTASEDASKEEEQPQDRMPGASPPSLPSMSDTDDSSDDVSKADHALSRIQDTPDEQPRGKLREPPHMPGASDSASVNAQKQTRYIDFAAQTASFISPLEEPKVEYPFEMAMESFKSSLPPFPTSFFRQYFIQTNLDIASLSSAMMDRLLQHTEKARRYRSAYHIFFDELPGLPNRLRSILGLPATGVTFRKQGNDEYTMSDVFASIDAARERFRK